MSISNLIRELNPSKLSCTVTVMSCGSHKASLMRAERLVGDSTFGLPPGQAIDVFPIAALPGCPESWVRGTGSYVCPVSSEDGLWFDWTMNDKYNTAVIPSVKGMNPITGQKIESLKLEKYINKCPIHNTDFSHDRYCEQCNYCWPPSNYVSYPNVLWWDGFRSPDGSVRQFFFTEDEKRDIASLVIGKENTVPAFGFVFYSTKQLRYIEPLNDYRGILHLNHKYQSPIPYQEDNDEIISSIYDNNSFDNFSGKKYSSSGTKGTSASFDGILRNQSSSVTYGKAKSASSFSTSKEAEKSSIKNIRINKEVSIGGGAKISQSLEPDSLALDAWSEKEIALIRLYFVFEEQLKQIIDKGGIKDISGTDEGYLSGLPLG
jgi:hypothetical protein